MKTKGASRLWAVMACLLLISPWLAEAATFDIGVATSGNWKVSGGGASNVSPYIVTTKVFPGGGAPGFTITGISVTSTAETNGTFVAGGTIAGFRDGFWIADYKFLLPSNAVNINLSYADLYCDDRVVLTLNGTPIAATGIISAQGTNGDMVFTRGGPTQPYSFSGPDGSVSGTAYAGFNVGSSNLLEAVANNTHTGIYGTNEPLSAGVHDQAILGMVGTLSYSLAPVFTGCSRTNNGFVLQFSGVTNTSYQIWASTNLTDWQFVGTPTEVSAGNYRFLDTAATNMSRRYYRSRIP
jgi:hypothetical protein